MNNINNSNKQEPFCNIDECQEGRYQQSEGYRISSESRINNNNADIEAYNTDNNIKGFDFKDDNIRKGFIRKVYCILMIQLLITFGIVIFITYDKPTQLLIYNNHYLIWIAFGIIITIIIILSCSQNIRRSSPINIILLGIFTFAEGFIVGLVSSFYDPDVIIISIGMTTIICLALTIFAYQTKWDFTIHGGILLILLVVFCLFGIITIFLPISKMLSLIYASIGAILFSIYLIYDTQLMIGGEHKYSISPEEYIFAVLNLYLDIINIFMYILAIIGYSRE